MRAFEAVLACLGLAGGAIAPVGPLSG